MSPTSSSSSSLSILLLWILVVFSFVLGSTQGTRWQPPTDVVVTGTRDETVVAAEIGEDNDDVTIRELKKSPPTAAPSLVPSLAPHKKGKKNNNKANNTAPSMQPSNSSAVNTTLAPTSASSSGTNKPNHKNDHNNKTATGGDNSTSPSAAPSNDGGGTGKAPTSSMPSLQPSKAHKTPSHPAATPHRAPAPPILDDDGTNGGNIPTRNPVPYTPKDDDPLPKGPTSTGTDTWNSNDETLSANDKQKALIALGVLLGVSFLLLVFTAHQLLENPDGLCASLCRLTVTCTCCLVRCVCFPCRALCGNKDRRSHDPMISERNHYTHDLELN